MMRPVPLCVDVRQVFLKRPVPLRVGVRQAF